MRDALIPLPAGGFQVATEQERLNAAKELLRLLHPEINTTGLSQ
jgi:hypothetical protein